MEKRISYTEFQSVRSVAKACDPIIRKRDTIKRNIEKLVEEYKMLDSQIQTLEAGIKNIIGFRAEELVKKVMEPTGAVGKDGKPVKNTKYVPTSIVSYDETTKQYVITTPDEPSFQPTEGNGTEAADDAPSADGQEGDASLPTTEEGPGSDFDIDAQEQETVF